MLRELVIAAALCTPLFAADSFVSTVLPSMRTNCFGCHGDGQTFGKLDLRSRDGMLKGGTSGAGDYSGQCAEEPAVSGNIGRRQASDASG